MPGVVVEAAVMNKDPAAYLENLDVLVHHEKKTVWAIAQMTGLVQDHDMPPTASFFFFFHSSFFVLYRAGSHPRHML